MNKFFIIRYLFLLLFLFQIKTIVIDISNCTQFLNIMNANNTVIYNIIANIDCINTPFTPIGDQNQNFEGKILGNGFTVKNINLVSSAQYVGKFFKNK